MIRAATSGRAARAPRASRPPPRAAALEALEHLRAAADPRHAQQQLDVVVVEARARCTSRSTPTKSPAASSARIRSRRSAATPERLQQRRVQRRVAEPDAVGLQAGGVERRAQHRQRLGGALRARDADQLDPGLQELARLPALRAHAAVGVREVAEAQRRLGVGVAGRDQPRDRDRHVRAQHEHVAVLVEHPVGRAAAPAMSARSKVLLVLERGRVDLAVAGALEHGAHAVGHRAQLAHLVGQHVARSAGDAVDPDRAERLRRRRAGRLLSQPRTGTSSTRVIRAPSSRSRSSIRS